MLYILRISKWQEVEGAMQQGPRPDSNPGHWQSSAYIVRSLLRWATRVPGLLTLWAEMFRCFSNMLLYNVVNTCAGGEWLTLHMVWKRCTRRSTDIQKLGYRYNKTSIKNNKQGSWYLWLQCQATHRPSGLWDTRADCVCYCQGGLRGMADSEDGIPVSLPGGFEG